MVGLLTLVTSDITKEFVLKQIPQSFTRNRPRAPFFGIAKQTKRLALLAQIGLTLISLGSMTIVSAQQTQTRTVTFRGRVVDAHVIEQKC